MMYGIRLACCSWLLLASYILIVVRKCMAANDTLTQSQELLPGQTLISPGQIFELGFFTPRNSSQMYVGIWYKIAEESMVVWVANRENSLSESDTSSRLMIGSDGNLKLIDGKQQTVWSTNVTFTWKTATVAVLSDKGDLILKDNSSALVLWESFNIPGDTFLANMMLGFNSKTGEKRFLRSWRTENDPAPGNYVFGLSEEAPAQIYMWTDFRPYWRGGPWNGLQFLGLPMLDQKYSNGITMIQDNQQGSVYLTYSIYNNSYVVTSSVSASGLFKIWLLDKENSRWYVVWETPEHFCDLYGACGSFGVCNKDTTPNCQCLKGFVPKSEQEWKKGNWTSGCVRQIHLPCERNNTTNASSNMSEDDDVGFWKLTSMKLPDQYEYLYNVDSSDCHRWCLINCSCAAYAYPSGIGCLVWLKDLLDIQQFSFAGEDLYLRLPVSALGVKRTGIRIIIIPLLIVLAIVLMCAFIYYFHRHKVKSRGAASKTQSAELQLIEFGRIRKATNNFSEANKLGSGGFGTVYEGALEDGQKIAVKRLSCHSGQGIEEFKNEVALISKLQHRNLVRLLGCCIEGEEKLLVFECLKNRSLDTFLFDATKRLQLDWSKRFNLIEGIARGLLYLHRDSRLKIIHRDLKASNVLLDDNMSPKISDFGLARAFQVSQEVGNTPRIAGTYGYMSPEYAMGGLFSEKSDIYSFGVLLLEIVSGKKNTGFSHQEKYFNLLGYAWQLWNEGNGFDLVDEALADSDSDSCFVTEVMRCIQIGLLCVQDHAAVRPTMSNVVQMLSSENDLPQPTQPTFTLHRMLDYDYQSPGGKNPLSVNEVTVSDMEGR